MMGEPYSQSELESSSKGWTTRWVRLAIFLALKKVHVPLPKPYTSPCSALFLENYVFYMILRIL